MHFEWDDEKNRSNFEKHKIWLDEAAQIFKGPTLTTIDNREDYGEIREISIGQLYGQICLVVAHTDREGRTRLISARRAKSKERKR